MDNLIRQKRELHHSKIRQHDLNQYFRQQRALLSTPPPQQARETINQALKQIKRNIDEGHKQSIQALRQYRNVAENYHIAQCLNTEVMFSYELPIVQMGILPLECSWVQVFLYLLQTQQSIQVRRQLLNILTVNLYQLRVSATLEQSRVNIAAILDKIPFGWCQHRQLWTELCDLFRQFLACLQLLGLQDQFFENHFSEMVQNIQLMANDCSFQKELHNRQAYQEVCLFILSLSHVNKNTYNPYIAWIEEYLGNAIIQNFNFPYFPFDTNCDYLRRLILLNVEVGGPDLLIQLQQFWLGALETRVVKYFELMNTFIYKKGLTLHTLCLNDLIYHVLTSQLGSTHEIQGVEIEKWMILILKRHFDNCNYIQTEEMALLLHQVSTSQSHLLHEDLYSQDHPIYILDLLAEVLLKSISILEQKGLQNICLLQIVTRHTELKPTAQNASF